MILVFFTTTMTHPKCIRCNLKESTFGIPDENGKGKGKRQ